MSKNIFFSVALASAILLSGCDYKDLDEGRFSYTMSKFLIHFDWNEVDSVPTEMRVAFYPATDETGVRGYTLFDVLNRDTVVEMPIGIYNVTAWNRDGVHTLTDGYSTQNTIYATTGPYSPHGNYVMPKVLDSLYKGLRVLDYPDYMVHTHKMGFELFKDNDQQVLNLSPDSMVVTVEVKLHGIAGLDHCKNVRATINNVAGMRFMSFDNLTRDRVAVMFDAKGHAEDSLVTAKFWVFGIEPTDMSADSYQMIMFFWMDAGQIYIPMDITKAMSAYTKEDKYILIESPDLDIDLRDYLNYDSGIVVDVNGWDNIDVPVDF